MAKFHINAKGDASQCRANKGRCPFGDSDEHFDSKEEARKSYEETQDSLARGRTPILREPTLLGSSDNWDYSGSRLLEATDSSNDDYYEPYYNNPTRIDVNQVVSITTGIDEKDWPESLKTLVASKAQEWGNVANWELDQGYYEGDPIDFNGPESYENELKRWYFNQDNAIDDSGVLQHVREKGYETKGLTPLEAIKTMLRKENNGKVLKAVENANSVQLRSIDFSKLSYAKTHYAKIDPVKPVVRDKKSPEITGVVLANKGSWRLIDGHHRLKWNSENSKNEGKFFFMM